MYRLGMWTLMESRGISDFKLRTAGFRVWGHSCKDVLGALQNLWGFSTRACVGLNRTIFRSRPMHILMGTVGTLRDKDSRGVRTARSPKHVASYGRWCKISSTGV